MTWERDTLRQSNRKSSSSYANVKFPVSPSLRIMDDTLREGSQTPNVVYTAARKA